MSKMRKKKPIELSRDIPELHSRKKTARPITQLVARPTEYKGVVYRSKSEAMFAKLLEHEFQWIEYEPRRFAVGDWTPDFYASRIYRRVSPEPQCKVCGKAHDMHFAEFPCEECGTSVDFASPLVETSSTLIEYKPTVPTRTYISECFAKYLAIHRWLLCHLGQVAFSLSYEIRFGSPYSEPSEVGYVTSTCFADDGLHPIIVNEDWIGDVHREQVLAHRFDLESK